MAESNGPGSNADDALNAYHLPRPLPVWLNASYCKHIVKGNFMTLSARPKTVEPAEWIAHQGKSSFRSLANSPLVRHNHKLTIIQSWSITETCGTL